MPQPALPPLSSLDGWGTPIRTLPGIARALGISRATLARWITDYHFPALKWTDGCWWTWPALIDAWLLETRSPAHSVAGIVVRRRVRGRGQR